ncbi:MAG: hypothetical protein SFV15_07245 [Polyangiaceae bacterium]|nr:hypothetical protein [Polyangiaceae bacterium]
MLATSKTIRVPSSPGDEPFSVQRVGVCWCVSGGNGPISRGQWHDFLHQVRVEAASRVYVLARTGDMAPNALQRAQLYQLASECDLRVAWLTSSPYALGAVRALAGGGLLQIAAFEPSEHVKAAHFLGLDPVELRQPGAAE